MKNLISVKNLLIAILLIVIVAYLVKDCSNKPDGGKTEVIIDTVYHEVKTETKVYVPKWRTKVETVEIPYQINTPDIPFDTAGLIKEYFSKYATIDTVKLMYNDSTSKQFGYGVIYDTISQNAIIARKIFWNYKIPTIRQTIIIHEQPKTQVYIGTIANVNSVQILSSVAGSVLYKTKNDHIYSFNAGLANNGIGGTQPFIGLGAYWKIKLRKPKPTDLLKLAK
jgi:hypothetical protein